MLVVNSLYNYRKKKQIVIIIVINKEEKKKRKKLKKNIKGNKNKIRQAKIK